MICIKKYKLFNKVNKKSKCNDMQCLNTPCPPKNTWNTKPMANASVRPATVVTVFLLSIGKHKCPDPIKKGDFHSSYEQNYPKHDGFKPEGKYKLIHKNFILPEDRFYG